MAPSSTHVSRQIAAPSALVVAQGFRAFLLEASELRYKFPKRAPLCRRTKSAAIGNRASPSTMSRVRLFLLQCLPSCIMFPFTFLHGSLAPDVVGGTS
jgi:hypothetical protein